MTGSNRRVSRQGIHGPFVEGRIQRLRAMVLSFLVLVAAAGCSGGGGGSGNPGGSGPPPGPAVTSGNAGEFMAQLDAAVNASLSPLLSQVPALIAKAQWPQALSKIASAAAAVGALHTLSPLEVTGSKGTARIKGAYFPLPWPPRFDVRVEYTGYSTDESLFLDGTMDTNFIVDDTVNPPVIHGLSRGSLLPRGSFGGAVELRARIDNGQRADTLLTSNGTDILLSAQEPPPFLAYVSTLAGNGMAGNQNGTGSASRFNEPQSVAVDEDGTVYVADTGNDSVREITPEGTVSTLASGIPEPYDLGINSEGGLIVSSSISSTSKPAISRVVREGSLKGSVTPMIKSVEPLCYQLIDSCDGRPPIGSINYAHGLDVRDGVTLVAQWASYQAIRAILPDGYVMRLRYTDHDCNLYTPGGMNDLALGSRGEIYYVNTGSACYGIFVLETDGTVRILAGNLDEFGRADGIGPAARFFSPEGIVFDQTRYLYVPDTQNSLIRRVDSTTGDVVRIAGCLDHTPGFDCDDDFGFRDGWGDEAQFHTPGNVALDDWGDLYVADTGNHSIRFIRIIADPDRAPKIDHFDPWTMQKGESGEVTIYGTNLAMTETVDLGSGITAQIQKAGYGRIILDVTVGPGAQTGLHSISVTTAFGQVTTPESLSLEILETSKKGPTVETISGTGEEALDVSVVPGEFAAFSFPTGLFAEGAERLLVADPLTQTVRLVSTKVGAVEELFQLLTYDLTGQDVNVLGGILSALGGIGSILDDLGISSAWTNSEQDKIRSLADQAIDAVCKEYNSDCDWVSLPWAGVPFSPGKSNGFRLEATFTLPTDIWAAGSGKYVIADTYNRMVRPVGYDFEKGEKGEPAPMQVFSSNLLQNYPFSAVLSNDLIYATLPAQGTVAQIRYKPQKEILNSWGGLLDQHRCTLEEGDGEHPLGVPLGMAESDGVLFVADPYCKTVFRITQNLNVPQAEDIRGDEPIGVDRCADGPVSFATFGAPMDVAVDGEGNIYVADAGCHSIRMIKDQGLGPNATAAKLSEFLEGHHSRISDANYERVQNLLGTASAGLLDTNRYWVLTVAGGADGQPGYADGPAESARFNAPTSVAYVKDPNGKEYLFVADTGNRRLRRIILP